MSAEIIQISKYIKHVYDTPVYEDDPSLEEIAGNFMTSHNIPVREYDLDHDRALLHNCLHDIEKTRDDLATFVFKRNELLDIHQAQVEKLLEEMS